MSRRKPRHEDLREACLREALAIVEEAGVEKLSLRDVARRLGVSHQAPYRHFASREHILAEMIGRAYAAFAAHLDDRPPGGSPHEDLGAMGRAYLAYALEHPLNYRLMFGTPLPDPGRHPSMMRQARHAFALLQDGIARAHAARDHAVTKEAVALDALFVWSTMHGLAGILRGDAVDALGVAPDLLAATQAHVLARIGAALGIDPPVSWSDPSGEAARSARQRPGAG